MVSLACWRKPAPVGAQGCARRHVLREFVITRRDLSLADDRIDDRRDPVNIGDRPPLVERPIGHTAQLCLTLQVSLLGVFMRTQRE